MIITRLVSLNHRLLDSPLRTILLVEEITRPLAGNFRSVSPPGHLLHLVLSGRVRQYADSRRQLLTPGSLVWYYQTEAIEGRILEAPWRFISINFVAPILPPPRDKLRIRLAHPNESRQIRALLRAWRRSAGSIEIQAFECFSLLNKILAECVPRFGNARSESESGMVSADRWWAIEKKLRLNLDQIPPLPRLARQSGMSLRSFVRSCVAATGLPPGRRITMLRLTHARHLLQVTRLSVTEIALQVGYPRVQEFSRAMHRHTTQTPREIRATGREFRHDRGPFPGRPVRRGTENSSKGSACIV